MRLDQLMEKNRFEELKAVFRFISTCSPEELAHIMAEIRCVHDNILVFNEDTKLLAKVESVCINGECVQLNLEREVKE